MLGVESTEPAVIIESTSVGIPTREGFGCPRDLGPSGMELVKKVGEGARRSSRDRVLIRRRNLNPEQRPRR